MSVTIRPCTSWKQGRAFKRVNAILPDAGITRTNAGHFLQEEVPDEIAATIRKVAFS